MPHLMFVHVMFTFRCSLHSQVLHSDCLFRAGLLDRRLRDGAAALVACFSGPQADSSTSDGAAVFFCHVYGVTVTHDVSWFWPAACSRAGSGSPLCAEQRPAASSRAVGGTPRTGGAADDLPVFWSRSAARRPWAERSPVALFFRLVSGRRPRAELQSGLQVMFPVVIAVTRVQNIVGSVMTITSSYFHLHLRALPGSGGGIGRLPSPKDTMFAAGPIH